MSKSSLAALVVAALLGGCAEDGAEPPPPSMEAPAQAAPEPEPVTGVAVEAPVPSNLDILPDSVLVNVGACPYECCEYGAWATSEQIPVATADRSVADTVFSLAAGERFTAVTGNVHVTEVGRVVVTREVLQHGRRGRLFEPGDTLVLLDYLGEGYHNVWVDGEVLSVERFWTGEEDWGPDGFFEGYATGLTRTEWWVQAENALGQRGWFEVVGANADQAGASPCAEEC